MFLQSSCWSLESWWGLADNPTAGAAGGTQARGSAALSSGGVVLLVFFKDMFTERSNLKEMMCHPKHVYIHCFPSFDALVFLLKL